MLQLEPSATVRICENTLSNLLPMSAPLKCTFHLISLQIKHHILVAGHREHPFVPADGIAVGQNVLCEVFSLHLPSSPTPSVENSVILAYSDVGFKPSKFESAQLTLRSSKTLASHLFIASKKWSRNHLIADTRTLVESEVGQ